jgi:DNA/RNA endonuclease YhcR with UshA esterase domain
MIKEVTVMFSIIAIMVFTNFSLADNTDIILADSTEETIKNVISNPKYYNGKKITVEGEVEQVHHITYITGDPYTLIRLHDDKNNEIGVYYKGNLSIAEGSKMRVTGTFKKEKGNFLIKFKNVIKAKKIEQIA